jgi:cob(I)alamin adenosyltransferase
MKRFFTKGYTHIYTGDGKGKTSAALGLAFRAAGSGIKSIVIQFMKGLPTGEQEASIRLGNIITIEQFGSRRFCRMEDGPQEEHRHLARQGLARAREVLLGGVHPIVILDEIITAVKYGLLSDEDIIALIRGKPDTVELVLTGRSASDALINSADLVTEMKEIKHYFRNGAPPRKGIED